MEELGANEIDGTARLGIGDGEELVTSELEETPTLDVIERDGTAELESAEVATGSARRKHAGGEESGKKCMGAL